MRLTKTDMARVIVTALYNYPALVPADHHEVTRRAKRGKLESLKAEHKLAIAAIYSRMDKSATGQKNGLCDECLGNHLDMTE